MTAEPAGLRIPSCWKQAGATPTFGWPTITLMRKASTT